MTDFNAEEQREFELMLERFKLSGMQPPDDIRQIFLLARRQRAMEPRIDVLDRATLRGLDVQDRDALLAKYVDEKIGFDEDRVARLMQLPRGLQVFYLSLSVEHEVLNGGFHQYFFNAVSDFAELVGPALRELGDDDAARLFESALKIADEFEDDGPEDGEGANQAGEHAASPASDQHALLEAFAAAARNSPFTMLDGPFAERASRFSALRAGLISAREESFLS